MALVLLLGIACASIAKAGRSPLKSLWAAQPKAGLVRPHTKTVGVMKRLKVHLIPSLLSELHSAFSLPLQQN